MTQTGNVDYDIKSKIKQRHFLKLQLICGLITVFDQIMPLR